jgi:hypothetical protein
MVVMRSRLTSCICASPAAPLRFDIRIRSVPFLTGAPMCPLSWTTNRTDFLTTLAIGFFAQRTVQPTLRAQVPAWEGRVEEAWSVLN